MAQGALNMLDKNPAALAAWVKTITSLPDDAGSERNLAEAHWDSIRPLLDRARALAATPEALDAQARFIDALVANDPAQPVEVSQGSGPLEPRTGARSYRARTEVAHE